MVGGAGSDWDVLRGTAAPAGGPCEQVRRPGQLFLAGSAKLVVETPDQLRELGSLELVTQGVVDEPTDAPRPYPRPHRGEELALDGG